ncbi:MAG: replicative helicase [Frankiales bacterium]|nr:replicative helicase [Frankiales bacterium]
MSERVVELNRAPSASVPHSPAPEFERTPPQDVAAEQSVLGGMLLNKDAIADVIEVVRSSDFYRPAHQIIFDVIVELYGKGEPADAITVGAELTKNGDAGRIGGMPYLHTLVSTVPTAANAGYYAKIVAELAILRRLVDAGTRIVQLGYSAEGQEVDDIVDRAQQTIYDVTERRTSEDYTLLEELMQPTMDELEAIGGRSGTMSGVPTGFVDLDTLTNGLHPGQLIVIAGRPGLGKSTLGLDIARSASIKNGQASVIFSLEMSKTEITMRLLSAEARVPLHHMRSGSMTDDDWARLARRMGEVAEAPLYIDDSPNLTMMEIRAKARRLKQRKELRLIVIDYLQLMTGNKKAESRQQEVSELSRSLKLLAKELEVPVIAMSQLNRGAEQRTDKKPMLSDLRESGCLPASTRVLRADTGAEVTLGSLHASGAREVPVWSLDSSLRYVRRHLTHVFSTGTRQVFRLRLASGKSVRATANHPFLTYDGWKPLGELGVGSRLAVPRHVPAPEVESCWSEDCIRSVAMDLVAGRALPSAAFSLPKSQLRTLLRYVLTASRVPSPTGRAYVLRSRRAADQVSRLLLRFGISCSLRDLDVVGRTQLEVAEGDELARLAGQVESGLDGDAAREAVLAAMGSSAIPRQTAPDQVWDRVRAAMDAKALQPPGRLAGVASALDTGDLELEATNDVFWDAVVEITPEGVEEVFDATVVGNHNFVADGIAVHNSIEQDADMVVLLHREDAYEKESPRAGEADFIVAKHRNGPTATITVAFQGHYSRFVDMSPS